METHKRRQTILAYLEKEAGVAIDDLAQRLAVSPNTVRNDLHALEAERLLRRVRGGAVLRTNGAASPTQRFASKANINRQAKEQIGRWAASLVQDGDTLVLDASSTVYAMVNFLGERRNLTVVTNGINIALLLASNPTNRVLWAANTLRPDGLSVVGDLHPALFETVSAAKCFITGTGLSLSEGLSEADSEEARLKQQMMKLARTVIALVDQSKFGNVDSAKFAALHEIDHLVTDDAMPPLQQANWRKAIACPITLVGKTRSETLPPLPAKTARRPLSIGFGNLSEKLLFAQTVRCSLQQAVASQDGIRLLVRDNQLDGQMALTNAEWFVNQGVDLVIEYQFDARAGNIIMDKFDQAGIPVIAVDIPLPGATFYGANNYRAGFIAGEALGRWIQQHWQGVLDHLLRLQSSRVGAVVDARLQGLQEGLEAVIGVLPAARVRQIDAPVIPAETEAALLDVLAALPRQDRIGIIALNDDVALGALAAFERAGRLDQVAAVGQGCDPAARQALRRAGFPFIGSTQFAPECYGEELLGLALKILQGEAAPPAVYRQHVFITSENLAKYYPQASDFATKNVVKA